MKKIVMIVSVAIASIGFSYGQQGQEHGQQQEGQMQQEVIDREIKDDEKEKINQNELPGMVQSQLKSGEYSDWKIEEVFRVEPETMKETGVAYVVTVEKGGEKKMIHYDANGKVVGSKMKGEKKTQGKKVK